MRTTRLATAVSAALGVVSATICASAFAAPVTFFGEDLNGPPRQDPNPVAAHPNADAARAALLSNLQGVGTETFESQSGGPPLALNFPGAGTATLTGGVGVASGNDSAGRYPISGSKYYYTGVNSFSIAFSAPIAAFGFYGVDIGDYGSNLLLSLTDTMANVTQLNVPLTNSNNGELSGSVIYFGFYDLITQYTNIAFIHQSGQVTDNFAFDDMTIGSLSQVKPTPEPGSLMLLGLGLAGLGLMRRRRN